MDGTSQNKGDSRAEMKKCLAQSRFRWFSDGQSFSAVLLHTSAIPIGKCLSIASCGGEEG